MPFSSTKQQTKTRISPGHFSAGQHQEYVRIITQGGLEQSLHTVILYKCLTNEYINVSKPEINNSIRSDHIRGPDQLEAHSALVCVPSLPFPPE